MTSNGVLQSTGPNPRCILCRAGCGCKDGWIELQLETGDLAVVFFNGSVWYNKRTLDLSVDFSIVGTEVASDVPEAGFK